MKKLMRMMAAVLLMSGCAASVTVPAEPVPSRDYQRCLDAEQMGGAEKIAARCGKLNEEIEQQDKK